MKNKEKNICAQCGGEYKEEVDLMSPREMRERRPENKSHTLIRCTCKKCGCKWVRE